MGDLGLVRRAPRGWLPATVASTTHQWTEHPDEPDGGETVFETSYRLTVTWQVRVPGREPYLVADDRKCPTWVGANAIGGAGKRWYSVRLRRTHGLLVGVEMPCAVDPADPTRIWVDWDAGYAAHEVAWRRRSAVDRAVAERRSGFDGVVARFSDPFAGRVTPEEQQAVDQRIADEQAQQAEQWAAAQQAASAATWAGVDPAEKASFDLLAAEMRRIDLVGRRVEGRLVRLTDTGAVLAGLPVRRLEVEIVDPTPRVVAVEVPLHQRMAKRYKPGTAVVVKVDPADPTKAAITRD